MTGTQDVLNAFQVYQKARVDFVQKVADLAKGGSQCVDFMQNAGVMNLMKPLLNDNVRYFVLSVVFSWAVLGSQHCTRRQRYPRTISQL